jgi:hypothetical protein
MFVANRLLHYTMTTTSYKVNYAGPLILYDKQKRVCVNGFNINMPTISKQSYGFSERSDKKNIRLLE